MLMLLFAGENTEPLLLDPYVNPIDSECTIGCGVCESS
jgi:hypothetical protein